MENLPRRLKLYFAVVGALGAVVVLTAVLRLDSTGMGLVLSIGLCVCGMELLQVVLPSGRASSFASSVVLAALWLFGAPVAIMGEVVGAALVVLWHRGPLHAAAFNIGQLALSLAGAGLVYSGLEALPLHLDITPLAMLVSAATFYGVNSALMQGALSLYKSVPFLPPWLENVAQSSWWAVCFLLAVFLFFLYDLFGTTVLWFTLAIIAAQRFVLKGFADRSQERAVNFLLELTALRDKYRPGHSDRVVKYVLAIADSFALDQTDRRFLRYAAFLHEVGSVNVVPGDAARRQRPPSSSQGPPLQQYPDEAARLISRLAPLVPVADVIRHLNEDFDGNGGPDGLAGEDIPLLSRILAVADNFDTLTAAPMSGDSLSAADALRELQRQAGTRFDPTVVQALATFLHREDPEFSGAVVDRMTRGLDTEVQQTIKHLKEYIVQGRAGRRLLPREDGEETGSEDQVLTELRQKAAGILVLYDLGQVINSSLSLDEVLPLAARITARATDAACALAIYEASTRAVAFQAAHAMPSAFGARPRVQLDRATLQQLQAGEPVGVSNLAEERAGPLERFLFEAGLKAFLCYPLLSRNRLVGIICASHVHGHRYTEEERNLLGIIAGQAALAIDNARLYTETKEALERISSMKQFTDTVLENVSTGIVVTDPHGRIQLINKAARDIMRGLAGSDVNPVGCPCEGALGDIIPGGLLLDSLEGGRVTFHDSVHVECNDRSLVFEVQTSPLLDTQGQVTGAVALFRDVSERRRMEEQIRQNEQMAMIGELAAGTAHEIRNPLTSIRGFIQMLHDRISEQVSEREYLEIVLGEIDRIDELIQDLLLMARPPRLKLEVCDLRDMLDEVCLLVSGDRAAAGVKFHREYAGDLPMMPVDVGQLRRVFINLFTNAIQAMEGGGEIRIRVLHHAETDQVEVRVSDTGVGIPPENLPKIFTPFFTSKEEGTGLGLAVSFGIVRNHGGKIEVESTPGRGTTFSVSLPVRRPGAAAPAQPA